MEGAFWTSYTLWHWANSGVGETIRQKTGEARDLDELRADLAKGNKDYKLFSLRQLIERQAYDTRTVEVVISLRSVADRELLNMIVEYTERASAERYDFLMERLLETQITSQRLKYLNSMSGTKHKPPKEFWARLGRRLVASNAYQEVNAFLKLLESKNESSPAVISQVTRLLDSDNILVARRAYWFLRDQELSDAQQDKMKSFRVKFANFL